MKSVEIVAFSFVSKFSVNDRAFPFFLLDLAIWNPGWFLWFSVMGSD